MLQELGKLVNVRYQYDNPEDQHRARLLLFLVVGVVVLSILTIIVLSVAWTITDAEFRVALLLPIPVLIVIMGGVWALVQDGRAMQAAYLFVGSFTLIVVLNFFTFPSAYNYGILAYLMPILAAAFLIDLRAMAIAAFVVVGIVTLVIGLQIAADAFGNQPDPDEYSIGALQLFLVNAVLGMLLVFGHVSFTNRRLRQSYRLQRGLDTALSANRVLRQVTSVSGNWFDGFVEELRHTYDIFHAELYFQTSDARLLELQATSPAESRSSAAQSINLNITTTKSLAVRRLAPVLTTSDSSLAQRRDFRPATRAELAIPMVASDIVVGVLVLHSENEAAFPPEQVRLLEANADSLKLALQQWQSQQQLVLQEQQIVRNQRQIEQYEQQISRLTGEIQAKTWDDYIKRKTPNMGFQLEDGSVQPARTPGAAITTKPRLETMEDGRQWLAVPIVVGGYPIGEMVFETPEGAQWTQQTLDLTTAVANRLALALDNTRLFDEVRSVAIREQMVSSMAADLQNIRDVDMLLNRAASMFNQILGTEHTYIRLGEEGA